MSVGVFSVSHGMRVTILALLAVACVFPAGAQAAENVVTLTQCLDAAMESGPGVKLSQTNLAMSQAQYRQTVAANSLGLSGSAGASRSQPIVNTTGLTGGSSPFSGSTTSTVATDGAQAGLSLSQSQNASTQIGLTTGYTLQEQNPLEHSTKVSLSASQTLWDGYLGGRGKAAVQQAGISLQVAEDGGDSAVKTVLYNVKQAYYTMLGQQRQIGVLQDTLTQRQEEMKRIQTLYDTQNATQIDVKQARVNLTTAQLNLAQAKSSLEVLRDTLSNLVGWSVDTQYSVAEVESPTVPSLDVAQSIKAALDQRDDLKQLQLNRASGSIALDLKKSLKSPVVSANGGVNWTRDWTGAIDLVNYSLGLQVSVPILDGGLVDQQIRQAQLQNDAYDLQINQLVAGIATDVKNAVYGLKDLLARADLAAASLELAKSQYDLAQAQFDTGVISTLDLLTASVALTTAEVNLAKAKSDAQLGALALQNVMGN